MKNVLNLQKISIKPILIGSIILFGTFYLMPNSMTYASLSDGSNLEESLDNIENVENLGERELENPNDSSENTENLGSNNNSGKNDNEINDLKPNFDQPCLGITEKDFTSKKTIVLTPEQEQDLEKILDESYEEFWYLGYSYLFRNEGH